MIDLRQKKLFLLDMDGTIYLGDDLFDGTLDFLHRVKERGGRMKLKSLQPRLKKLFVICALDTIMEIEG